ncbi:hypothetical protein ET524_09715 [Senegalimassilia faecalis]|uniref:XRE family transcriptional regulator n=1 Tax=Senegalimassilia faecalis TaxID=2509433 RepID=A0A4V1QU49_9ACTN|nr:hypothetical protein [Senegalimassilia faecalis]RXZ54727.1 hypothetical protein ET524_09715 [Senegalimassilia faecalis]
MYRRYTDGVPHPPLVSEYEGPDSGGVPDLFVSAPGTCRELSDELLDFMWYRELTIAEAAALSSISEEAVEDLVMRGKGEDDDLLALCRVLRVELYALPGREALERGLE